MKKNAILILSIISVILLIGSFPLKLIAENVVVDICRLVGFVLILVVLGLRISQMIWYRNMTEQQRKDFKKVIIVGVIGIVAVVLVPTIFHIVY